jgi:hypothetical protein
LLIAVHRRLSAARAFPRGADVGRNRIFSELQEEMRNQYAIGYTPTDPEKQG